MRQLIKKFSWVGFLAFGLQASWGFALLGPLPTYPGLPADFGDAWQVPEIGYGLGYEGNFVSGGDVWLGDIGGPKNLGEEYRRNVPVLYYAYDDNFSGPVGDGWFGQAGENAVDQAFAIMNSLTNVDSYSSDLHEFPFQSQTVNYKAAGLYLTDIKSVALHLLVEQLGLTEPERYTWTLHDRYAKIVGVSCPENMMYLVVQRNFNPIPTPLNQVQYSAMVNNVTYSYFIEDDCDHHPPAWGAITVPRGPDPSTVIYTAVAANDDAGIIDAAVLDPATGNILVYNGGLQVGGFYTGLTYDDVGGLRYLMSTNNVNYEAPAAGSVLIGSTTIGLTNLGPQTLLYTSNYTAFWLSAQTNAPTILSNLFPGLVILSSANTFTTVATPNVVAYYTNLIGAPFGSPPVLVVRTNSYTTNALEIYSDTYANIVMPNGSSPNTSASLVTVTVGVQTGAAVGSPLVTNTTAKAVTVANLPSGEYYINTNYLCGPDVIVSPQPAGFPIAIVTATTNLLYATSNSAGYFTSQSLVTYSTSHVYVVQQPICTTATTGAVTNGPAYYQGIGRVRFVKLPDGMMDPLTHNLTNAIVSQYTNFVYNTASGKLEARIFVRTLTQPDIIISAADLAAGPNADLLVGTVTRPVPQYETTYILPGLSGPGVIDGQTTFTFNKVGPIFWNGPFSDTNGFTDLVNETTQMPALQWASFDGSTNDPILYPNGTSIQELENAMYITISPASLPDGANNAVYPTTTFSATGGTAPYTWSLAGTSLPQGLTLSSAGVLSGTPSNNPTGLYDFTIQVTDSSGQPAGSQPRVVALNYTITIH
jgi:hypothetical protein